MKGIKILGTGSYIPPRDVVNEEFTKIIETSDEWITTRTGIKSRHLSQGEPTWYMGAFAAKEAIKVAGISGEDIGLILTASVTADFSTPSLSCIIQREIGAIGCMAIDVNCACAGFVYALDMARRYLITEEEIKYVLVIGAENLSKLADYSDRSGCILYGDGAAAVVVERAEERLYSSHLGANGNGGCHMVGRLSPPDNAFMPEERVKIPDGMPESNGIYLFMNGKEVYKFAIKALPDAVNAAAAKISFDVQTLDKVIPHQANIRIIQTAAQNLGLPIEKFFINIDRFGNTSSASIPLALDEAVRTGAIKRGDKVALAGFGAGLTYGAIIFEY